MVEPPENTIFVYSLINDKYSCAKSCIEGETIKSLLFPELNTHVPKTNCRF